MKYLKDCLEEKLLTFSVLLQTTEIKQSLKFKSEFFVCLFPQKEEAVKRTEEAGGSLRTTFLAFVRFKTSHDFSMKDIEEKLRIKFPTWKGEHYGVINYLL